MSQEIKNRVLVLARKSKLSELDDVLKSFNIHWTECQHPSGDTPLHTAAQHGNILVLRHLLDIPKNDINTVDVTNSAGKTALHEACQNSQPEAVSFLLSKGANARAIKQADWTPLMLACTKRGEKSLACCNLLLENGGQVLLNDRNKDGWNALHIAAREGDESIVKRLLLASPYSMQASMRSNNGRTPLHTAALHGHELVLQLLLKQCPEASNSKDSCGSTPLHDAVRSGNLAAFKVLVEAGADLTVLNNEGYGIQHMAAQTGQIDMLTYLTEELGSTVIPHMAQPSFKTTPLHCAVRAGQIKSVQMLLKIGANPNTLDLWGRSCYDIIPEKNIADIKYILDHIQR